MNEQPKTPPLEGFWDVAVAAARCGVTRHFIQTEIIAGRLPAIKDGKNYKLCPDAVLTALKVHYGYDPEHYPKGPVQLTTVSQFIKRTGIDRKELATLLENGKIPYFQLGTAYAFNFDVAYAAMIKWSGAQ